MWIQNRKFHSPTQGIKFYKMNTKTSYTQDILKIVPNDARFLIQAPNLEDSAILKIMLPTEFDYFKEIKLTALNRNTLIERILNSDIEDDFQSIEIRLDDNLLFEGYDGMQYGTITSKLELPTWFVKKYIENDLCNISNSW